MQAFAKPFEGIKAMSQEVSLASMGDTKPPCSSSHLQVAKEPTCLLHLSRGWVNETLIKDALQGQDPSPFKTVSRCD